MALFHLSVTQTKRSAGQSAIASAAYRAGERLYSEYYGEYSDYTRKGGVICSDILLPSHAPPEYADRQTLWNAVEKAERGKNAQLAYSFDIALQNEFSLEENIALARQFLLENFVSRGMVVDFAVHQPDREDGGIPNPHFHVLCPIRPIEQNGKWGLKQRRVYELDEDGNRIRDADGKFVFNAVPTTDWGSPETLEHWREAWAEMCNAKFAEKGLDLTLVTGFGADKTMTAVISGEADIGFMGAEASVYAYQEGATDPVVNFAQLTQRAGNFLVAREEMPDFKWEDLKGEKVLGGRKGGMPEMVFEYILKKNGMDPQKDLTIDQSIDFGSTAAAFTSDDSAAYTVEFEPSATILEKEGAGYVVASLGEASGYVPYTSYSTKASYMKENPEIIQKFTDALQKGMDYVQSHTPEEIAEVIAPQFKETDLETITAIVKRYYDQDTWKENLIFEKDSFELLQDILEDAGELTDRTAYENLVQTEYAQKACEN